MKPKHYILQEMLPRDFYSKWVPVYGERLWLIFDQKILYTLDALREIYNKIIVNTWWWGGSNQLRLI